MNKPIISNPLNGTRDFIFNDMHKREYIFHIWTKIAEQHNFSKYDAPIIERTELYSRKSGEDIIKEMFFFETEKQSVCLRPEMTPSLVRIINNTRISRTTKLFSIAQCWRFETVTTFRKREHYQLNCDIVGSETILSDVEILNTVVNIFKAFGFCHKDIKIKISNRRITNFLLKTLNLSDETILCVIRLLDSINKIDKNIFIEELLKFEDVDENKISNIFAFTQINNIDQLRNILANVEESKPYLDKFEQIFNLSKLYDIENWLVIDFSIVRGLNYYTDLVFECFSTIHGFSRAICGGGRYDNIMTTYGFKKNYSFVGFGMGDVVLQELLTKHNLFPPNEQVDYCLIVTDENRFNDVFRLANILRNCGNMKTNVVDKIYTNKKNLIKYLSHENCKFAIWLGKTESEDLLFNCTEKKENIINIDAFITNFII